MRVIREPRMHSSRLVPLIKEIVIESGRSIPDIGAIAVSKGPGSFTGLRIGVSTAKGMAYALGIPLVGVETFEALAHANTYSDTDLHRTLLVTIAPSRKNETYWQAWRLGAPGDLRRPESTSEARSDTFEDAADMLLENSLPMTIVGPGADELLARIQYAGSDAMVIAPDDARPAVTGVSALGHELLALKQIEDVAQFEPFYLKAFVARKGGSPFDRLGF
jgi:tRNA threonylcarbamoyladenosine biosynthesis protein TsaB